MLIAKLLRNDKFAIRSEEGTNIHMLFENAIEIDLFNNMFKLLDRFHAEQLDLLKEAYLQFFDSLFSCSCYDLFLKPEVAFSKFFNRFNNFIFSNKKLPWCPVFSSYDAHTQFVQSPLFAKNREYASSNIAFHLCSVTPSD